MDESPDLGLYRRSNYKEVWTALSASEAAAKTHVGGSEDEGELTRSGIGTTNFLLENVGVDSSDVVLEIGCGIGRVGKQLASRCREWIGCDVSGRMLNLAEDRLREFPNVELVETSGYDLKPIADVSVDLVIARRSSCIWSNGIATITWKKRFASCERVANFMSIMWIFVPRKGGRFFRGTGNF